LLDVVGAVRVLEKKRREVENVQKWSRKSTDDFMYSDRGQE
jgi:hypothetical protein